MKLSRNLAVVALLMSMLLWSSAYIAMKFALQYYEPMVIMAGRMLVASAIFLVVWRHIGQFQYRAGDWRPLLVMVLAEPCLYFVFEGYALQYTSAQQAGVVLALLPLLASVGAWLWLGEKIRRQAVAGFALAIAGAVWLSFAGEADAHAPNPLLGNLLELGAVICAVVYVLAVKRLTAHYNPWTLTALQSFAGSLFFLPLLALPQVSVPDEWWPVAPEAAGAILFLGAVVNIGAYGLYNLGTSYISANQSAAFINLIPVMTLALAWLILGERLNAEQMLACLVVMSGILLSQWRPSRGREAQELPRTA